MEFLQDLLAAIGVVLNGIPQGLLAMSLGFASVPTALGFLVGAAGCAALGSVAPISFQAETVVMAGTMGKNMRERLSMVLFAGITMAVLGACGLLTVITNFAGDVVLHAMMAGVGLVLTKLSLGMLKENALVGGVSIAVAFLVYFFLGHNLVYTIVLSLVAASVAAKLAKQDIGGGVGHGDILGAGVLGGFPEKGVAQFPGGLLQATAGLPGPGRHIAGAGEQLHRGQRLHGSVRTERPLPAAAQGDKLPDKLHVLGGLRPPEPVVEVGGGQGEIQLPAQPPEPVEQIDGIRAAGDGAQHGASRRDQTVFPNQLDHGIGHNSS